MTNPFSLSFGKSPLENIDRPVQKTEILDAFLSNPINQQIYMITGIRGSGKTVLMTDVSRRLSKEDDWTVIELNPETDMLHSFAAKLSRVDKFSETFRSAKINLSLLGLGLAIDGGPQIADDETAISRMLDSIRKRGDRVLVAVDEVTNNENIRKFVAAFQIFIRAELPVFLLMTGLFENVDDLQNQKSLTFLYRAPKIQLQPLNIPAIATRYRGMFHMEEENAYKMARLTKGYAFAFQVLGYLTFRSENQRYEEVLAEYRQYLEDFVYEKLWSELSVKD
ncbi:MAG: ATP-binding protein, partial [Oscillospiraceae bacterium]|nr:ATP-binding protein [Oscillospiraceae bacterium]